MTTDGDTTVPEHGPTVSIIATTVADLAARLRPHAPRPVCRRPA